MNSRKEKLQKLRLPSKEAKPNARNGFQKHAKPISNYFPTDIASTEDEDEDKQEITKCTKLKTSPIICSPSKPSTMEPMKDESPEMETRSRTRVKLKTFLPVQDRLKHTLPKEEEENPQKEFIKKFNDFETPAKTTKVAPKTKKAKPTSKPKTKKRSKKQPTIKSAFFQNEELFSDVTAQHCLVDNVNPDEMQLALALSRSEMELSGATTNVENSGDSNEGIRDKLKKFGFKVAETEEINYITAYKVSKGKNKWAQKFTALTLRSAKRQLEKVQEKIEEILRINSSPEHTAHEDDNLPAYSLQTSALLPFLAVERIIEFDSCGRSETVDFYVLSLFEPSKTKPGHLLKNVHRIPGRDRTPDRIKLSPKNDVMHDERPNSPLDSISSMKNEIDLQLQSPAIKKSKFEEKTIPDEGGTSENESSRSSLPPTSNQRRRKTPSQLNFQNTTMEFSLEAYSEDRSREEANINEGSQLSFPPMIYTDDSNQSRKNPPSQDMAMEFTLEANDFSKVEQSPRRDKVKAYAKEDSECSQLAFPSKTYTDDSNQCRKNAPSENSLQNMTMEFTLEASGSREIESRSISSEPYPSGLDNGSQVQLRPIRATSPDIFADSDVEMESDDTGGVETLKFTATEQNIETFEIFSSDEVQTLSASKTDACDKNHNSLSFTLDLTQQESSCSPPETIEEFPYTNDLPSTSFGSSLNEKTLKWPEPTNSTENSFHSSVSAKSFSFDKSKEEDNFIDLTQNEDDMDCIMLTDDEVNYSIRKADISLQFKNENISPESSFNSNSIGKHEFSFIDLVTATEPLPPTQSEEFEFDFDAKSPTKSVKSLDLDLSKVSEFGILEEQSPFKTPTKTPKKTPRKTPTTKSPKSTSPITKTTKCRRTLSESFLCSPMMTESTSPLKRFSSSNKFKEFTKSDEDSYSDLDDIDKLIFGSPTKKLYKKPTGLTQLLTGPINDKLLSPEKPPKRDETQEFDFNGRTYLVRTVDASTRPNFATMGESALLDRLYRYGIKPLKRKQAEKILEYIYNQTHPRLVEEADLPSSSSTPMSDDEDDGVADLPEDDDIGDEMGQVNSKFNFEDCWGHVLVTDDIPSMEIKDEQYFFHTNTSKKISTAALPLHIAWYNLLKSNTQLNEAILFYEPIDLQEVYLFLKSIGYRYNPKDLKYFFDSRSIIFRYDVKKSELSGANRHVRKENKKRQRKKVE